MEVGIQDEKSAETYTNRTLEGKGWKKKRSPLWTKGSLPTRRLHLIRIKKAPSLHIAKHENW